MNWKHDVIAVWTIYMQHIYVIWMIGINSFWLNEVLWYRKCSHECLSYMSIGLS